MKYKNQSTINEKIFDSSWESELSKKIITRAKKEKRKNYLTINLFFFIFLFLFSSVFITNQIKKNDTVLVNNFFNEILEENIFDNQISDLIYE